MENQSNIIENISNSFTITNKIEAYLQATDSFEQQASKFSNNSSFMCRKSAEEVSIRFSQAKSADCEYMVYTHCFAAEVWLSKAITNAL